MAARALVVLPLLLLAAAVSGVAAKPLGIKLLTASLQDGGQGWLQV